MQQLANRPAEPQVQPVDQYPIYELGGALQELRLVAAARESSVTARAVALYPAQYHLRRLLHGVPFSISFCREAARTLLENVNELVNAYDPNAPDNALTDSSNDWKWYSVRTGIDIFEHQFSAELKKTATYAVPQKGIFSTEGLVDMADNHIHETVRASVPEFALEEFRASGRCLAFGLYSASGFHAARAVESVLRKYHDAYLPDQPSETKGLVQMAGDLESMHKATTKSSLLPSTNAIRHLRDFANFDRNPLIHRTVTLEEFHALTFFNLATGLIVEMVNDLPKEAPAAPSMKVQAANDATV